MGGTFFNTPGQQQRLAAVCALLRARGPTDIDDVADLLGVRRESALPYLYYLRDSGLAHRRGNNNAPWLAGPSDEWIAAEAHDDDAAPQIVYSYANRTSGQARRDPLVAALFGPAPAIDKDAA